MKMENGNSERALQCYFNTLLSKAKVSPYDTDLDNDHCGGISYLPRSTYDAVVKIELAREATAPAIVLKRANSMSNLKCGENEALACRWSSSRKALTKERTNRGNSGNRNNGEGGNINSSSIVPPKRRAAPPSLPRRSCFDEELLSDSDDDDEDGNSYFEEDSEEAVLKSRQRSLRLPSLPQRSRFHGLDLVSDSDDDDNSDVKKITDHFPLQLNSLPPNFPQRTNSGTNLFCLLSDSNEDDKGVTKENNYSYMKMYSAPARTLRSNSLDETKHKHDEIRNDTPLARAA